MRSVIINIIPQFCSKIKTLFFKKQKLIYINLGAKYETLYKIND